jgi:protein-S-isoprenylcysteine O-methyltransferase Ste14
VGVLAVLVVPGIERHFRPSRIPVPVVLAADAVIALGFLIIFFTFRENSHASTVIEVSANQQVISTGPYAHVRHPMYSGANLMFLATPFALGSLWALVPALLLVAVIVARLLDEERFLSKNLPGYDEYRRTVRYRLVPHVW